MMSSPCGTLQSVRSGGAPDREGLNVPVLATIGVGGRAELDLEGDVFAKIAIRVEAKGVESFVAEGVGRADAGVRIHGQSHHRCARAAAKQVEVADVDAGVFFCSRRIEMMRHGESSPKEGSDFHFGVPSLNFQSIPRGRWEGRSTRTSAETGSPREPLLKRASAVPRPQSARLC